MSLVETLYASENPDHTRMLWNKFLFLSPKFTYLKMDPTIEAITKKDKTFPLDAFEFCFFPGMPEVDVNEGVRRYMNRGIRAINSLCELYLGKYFDREMYRLLYLQEVQHPLDLSEFVRQAYENWEKGTMGRSRVDPKLRVQAYNSLRALELGYRVGIIDQAPEVQNSIGFFQQIRDGIKGLLGFKNPQGFDSGSADGPNTKWETEMGIETFSTSPERPFAARRKYLDELDHKPRYDSILMKIYSDLEHPGEIRDYIGMEIIVKDDEARNRLVDYFRRRTRPACAFEGFKDTTKGGQPNKDSLGYGVKKFFLRVPARLGSYKKLGSVTISNAMIPVEIQILTLQDARVRENIAEVSHFEYKKRKFMRVLPGLFPRELYGPLLVDQVGSSLE